ncbi:RNA polymerase sigma factor [Parapedobacter deserti]|uniref:RNA polymerase sigma factor n=1 Tax=Parapedobacter deserti TaxID=1912957 RepID=A0ABV7JSU9_9SPHI
MCQIRWRGVIQRPRPGQFAASDRAMPKAYLPVFVELESAHLRLPSSRPIYGVLEINAVSLAGFTSGGKRKGMGSTFVTYWNELRAGNKEALYSLYTALYFHMVRDGLRIGADEDLTKDCINQLFLKLWERRAHLKPVAEVRGYLMTAFQHLVHDELHDRRRLGQALDHLAAEIPKAERSYEEILISSQHSDERRMRLGEALSKLTPKQLELIRLKFFENRTYEEIAYRESISIKTAYNTIYDAVKRLRTLLKP